MKKSILRWITLSVLFANLSMAPFANAADNTVVIEQIGDYNVSNVVSEGDGNSLELQQTGNSNSSDIGISGATNIGFSIQQGNNHLVDILITGNNNEFSLSQNSLGEIVEHQNSILLRQEGNNNYATHTQIGVGNSQDLAQLGNDNTADLVQDGNDNTIILEQNGDFNSATLNQFGDAATPIEIYQTGGAAITITHTAGGS